MASSSNREGDELKTPVDDTPQVADGPNAAVAVAVAVAAFVAVAVVAAVTAFADVAAVTAFAAVTVAAVGGLAAFVAVLNVADELNAGARPGSGGTVLLRGAAGLLPGWAVCRYREEWAGELYDLRAEGAPWWRRAGYILGILLFSAPRLAVGLRLGGERSRA
ncbi:hypothetical protein [Micromonospora antibiotica]|uniref:Uncharacterized protein n=1 Tax=Micromonospora antibiotica TaxID=2807623 RepID=A0ABS3V6Z5_9ACTN|nr:hypothetical protein [Micromonospora antibiotica]MBO4161373.1 hypothetical protein [Micromonospora antibiotica]